MLDCFFTRSFYKHILGQPLNWTDIEDHDYEYFKNLKWILHNPIDGVMDLTWSYETDNFGKIINKNLKENGRNEPVTD